MSMIVSVPLAKACEYYLNEYTNLSRFPDFEFQGSAQTALNEYANREGLLAYQG